MGIFTKKVLPAVVDPIQTRSEAVSGSGVVPPPRPSAPLHISQERALGLISVFRSVQVLSTAVGSLTVDTWRGADPTRAPLWVRQPDAKMTRAAFLGLTTTSLALQGNAFWRVIRSSPVDPITALVVLDPNEVVVNEDGTYGWREKTFQSWEVQHLQYLRIAGRVLGLGPVQAARATLRGAIDLRDYAGEWFEREHVPSGVLSTSSTLNQDQAQAYTDQFNERGGRGTTVLGHGLKYEPILLSPEEALWIEAQQFSVTDIARLFGIPAHLLLAVVEGSSMTYTNVSQADLTFVRYSLSTYTREIEEALSALLPRGNEARFNLDAILRSDTTTRYAAHAVALGAGFLTVNEVRATEGLAPLPGGDEIKAAPAVPKEDIPNE